MDFKLNSIFKLKNQKTLIRKEKLVI